MHFGNRSLSKSIYISVVSALTLVVASRRMALSPVQAKLDVSRSDCLPFSKNTST